MGTAIKHPVPDRVKPSFVIFDIRTLPLPTECFIAVGPPINYGNSGRQSVKLEVLNFIYILYCTAEI